MKQIAEKIAADFLHVRVDFFYENSQIIFGELTFTTSAGFGKIDPPEFDLKMGDWLTLPTKWGGVTLHNSINSTCIFNRLQNCREAA